MPTVNGLLLIPLPTVPAAAASLDFTMIDIVGETISPFTGQVQTYDWRASWLEASVNLPPMPDNTGRAWVAFLMALRGITNVFQLGDPLGINPLGSAAGAPVVRGGGQTGYALATSGWVPGASGVLLPGDWLQVGFRLYRNLVQVNADGVGDATLSIWPQLRESPTDGTTVVLHNTQGLWRLKSNSRKWSESDARMYGVQFDIVEAI